VKGQLEEIIRET